jgi:hypothetical protein
MASHQQIECVFRSLIGRTRRCDLIEHRVFTYPQYPDGPSLRPDLSVKTWCSTEAERNQLNPQSLRPSYRFDGQRTQLSLTICVPLSNTWRQYLQFHGTRDHPSSRCFFATGRDYPLRCNKLQSCFCRVYVRAQPWRLLKN